jgi:undecaprenyl-diphosphatase
LNDYLLSAFLGVIEGLTEFLPVSSTAHLRIAEAMLGLDLGSGYWKMFAIVIQLGAILTLPIYFWRRIAGFLATFPAGERGDRTLLNHPLSLTLIAFAVTAAPAYLLTKVIGKNLESLSLMAGSLIAGGVIMWVVDAAYSNRGQTRAMDDMTMPQAVWIGLCQLVSAVVPGTSRSMATIAGGQLAGMTRGAAVEFSFFLSIPTMAVATGYEALKTLRHGSAESVAMNGHLWTLLVIGFLVSFAVAYSVVAWFMAWVRHLPHPRRCLRALLGLPRSPLIPGKAIDC